MEVDTLLAHFLSVAVIWCQMGFLAVPEKIKAWPPPPLAQLWFHLVQTKFPIAK